MKKLHEKGVEQEILEGCKSRDPLMQKALYYLYYRYAMGVSLRFSRNREDAQEIAQDAFIKVFKNIDSYNPALPFKKWFRKIIVYTAIDKFRRQEKSIPTVDITYLSDLHVAEDLSGFLESEDLLRMIQQLSPAYQMVFNLFVVEGFTHKEIAEQLGITEGTSKSNLAKARIRLQKMLGEIDGFKLEMNYG